MIVKYSGCGFIFLLLSVTAFSQSKLLLYNGKLISADSSAKLDTASLFMKFKGDKKSIFSIIHLNDEEEILYKKSSPDAGKLILYNGKMIPFRKLRIIDDKIFYLRPYDETSLDNDTSVKKFKNKKREDVFSIKFNDKVEKVLYMPDTSFNGELNLDEMRMFINGEQDAIAFYNTRLSAIGGFATGISGSILAYYSVIVPAIYLTAVGAKTPKIEKVTELKANSNVKLQNSEYISGFQKKAKDKNIISGAKGALIGLLAGFITLQLVFGK